MAGSPPVATPPHAVLLPSHPGVGEMLLDAWRGRGLLPSLANRFLSKFGQGAKLGRLWLLIRPLMDSLGKTVLFGGVLDVSTGGRVPYFLFLLAGLIGWRIFDRSLLYAARSFGVYQKLMLHLNLPLMLVPLAGMAYPALDAAVYGGVFLGGVLCYWLIDGTLYLAAPDHLLLAVAGLALMVLVTVACALLVALLNAKARDVRYILRYLLPMVLYLTPVVYPPSELPSYLRWLGTANPLSGPIEMIRTGLIGSGHVEPAAVASSFGTGCVLMAVALVVFSRHAGDCVDAYGRGRVLDESDDL